MNSAIKNKILEKSEELAYVFGLKRLTVDAIAKECGISKKTIYKNFKSKHQIINTVVDDLIENIKDQISLILEAKDEPEEKIFNIFDIPFQLLGNMPRIIIADVERYYPEIEQKLNNMREIHRDSFVDIYKDGVKKGVFRDFDPILVAAFFRGAGEAVLSSKFLLKNNLTIEKTLHDFHELLINGFFLGTRNI